MKKLSKYGAFLSVFSGIWTEYGDLWSRSPYSVQIWENAEHENAKQKKSVFGQFARSVAK